MDLDYTRLSPEETKCRKKAGLCFHCGKTGHMGRNCPNNRNKKQGPSQPKEGGSRINAIERPLSPISEGTYVEGEDPAKDFQED